MQTKIKGKGLAIETAIQGHRLAAMEDPTVIVEAPYTCTTMAAMVSKYVNKNLTGKGQDELHHPSVKQEKI